MKMTKKVLFVAVILAVAFTAMPIIAQDSNSESPYPVSNFKIPRFKDEMYIQPDPNNPYQGTWIGKGVRDKMYTIVGMEATAYVLARTAVVNPWRVIGVYQVENNDSWVLSDNNTTLNSGYLFERYIQE